MRKKEKELSKSAAIGQTTGMLAHDIKKPFTQLKALLDMLDRFKANPSELEKGKKAVEKSIKNVQSMLEDITDFSREVKLDVKPCSLISIMDFGIRQASQGFGEYDIRFQYSLMNNYQPHAEEERLARVLINLFVNAIEAITLMAKRTRGTIEISSADRYVEGVKMVEITIANDGPSLDEEDLGQIFESFYTKGKGKGTGLGLASAKKIVILHGGEISARNKPDGEGVEFKIIIPASGERETGNANLLPGNISEIVRQESRHDESDLEQIIRKLIQDNKTFKVLLLEDEALYRASVRNTIKKNEELDKLVTLYEAQNVGDALKLADHEKITHAIIDVDLNAVKDGYDFLREIKKRSPELPCMVHSNRSLPSEVAKAKKLGAESLIPKPLSLESLVLFLGKGIIERGTEGLKNRDAGRKIVFFSDDDTIMRLNIEMLIREIDPSIKVVTFETGEKLFEHYARNRDCAAVITDQNMGSGMTGLDLVGKIKEIDSKCKCYIVSNLPRSAFLRDSKESAIDGYYEAPIRKEDLSSILKK